MRPVGPGRTSSVAPSHLDAARPSDTSTSVHRHQRGHLLIVGRARAPVQGDHAVRVLLVGADPPVEDVVRERSGKGTGERGHTASPSTNHRAARSTSRAGATVAATTSARTRREMFTGRGRVGRVTATVRPGRRPARERGGRSAGPSCGVHRAPGCRTHALARSLPGPALSSPWAGGAARSRRTGAGAAGPAQRSTAAPAATAGARDRRSTPPGARRTPPGPGSRTPPRAVDTATRRRCSAGTVYPVAVSSTSTSSFAASHRGGPRLGHPPTRPDESEQPDGHLDVDHPLVVDGIWRLISSALVERQTAWSNGMR